MHSSDSTFHGRLARLPHRLTPMLAAFCLTLSMPAFGQEDEAEDAAAEDAAEEEQGLTVAQASGPVEEVVVTGSRLRRSTYTSVAPLQIINAEVKREVGLIDAGEIIQQSTASQGWQIDLTFQGFVLDDGPGTTTANLRGLGATRTLVLVDGRRIGPSGVEGAPVSADLSILPALMIEQYDQLLDGASSVYGSDAVAGVVNALLRKDFDGFEVQFQQQYPGHGAGDRDNVSVAWGRNFDRGFIGVGAQYTDTEAVTLADRPWTAGCERHAEIDQAGRVRHQEHYYTNVIGMEWDDCRFGSVRARVSTGPPFYSVYYTPGFSNGTWPDFSESQSPYGSFAIDGDGDGRADISYRDYDVNGREQFAHLFPDITTTSAMAYGQYTFDGEMNLTPYFEVLRSTRETFADAGAFGLFPDVPAANPYNICNPAGAGVDCGLAGDGLLTNSNYLAAFSDFYAGLCASFGLPPAACTPATFGLLRGAIGPIETTPIVSVRGDRNTVSTDSTQWRHVAGLRGDLTFLNVGSLVDWTFDASVTMTRSEATASRPGIRKDRMALALGYYSESWTPCEANISEETRQARVDSENEALAPLYDDTAPGCVPVNMFAPSLYTDVVGDFGSQAERDYLFDIREFLTEYDQTVFSYYMSGTVFQLPAGEAAAGVGVEYRIDEIRSIPDTVAKDGLLIHYFADGGAVGEKYTREAFGEIELPLLAGKPAATEVTANLSVRWTDDEYYGGAWTGAAKLGWRPIDSLLLRATWGTSYRAPNMRELFLRAQTGFRTIADPCLVPEAAIDALTEEYDPALDTRDQHVLDNCRATGVDPLAGTLGFNQYSVEFASGGSLTLDEETSESKSFGFAWDQPFTNLFDLSLGLTYYNIEIEDTIIEPTWGYIFFDCYYSQTSAHTFCGRISRDADPTRPLINLIDAGFINRDSERVRGVDLNLSYDHDVRIFDRVVSLRFEATGHRLIQRTTLQINDQGDRDEQFEHRLWRFPEHRAELRLQASYKRVRATWESRYIGNQIPHPDGVDDWLHANSGNPRSDTCLGPPDDVLCRDLDEAGDYWVHNMGVTYSGDSWSVNGGMRNVFDRAPPIVDGNEVFSINNTPLSAGYDLRGRIMFLGATVDFGGG